MCHPFFARFSCRHLWHKFLLIGMSGCFPALIHAHLINDQQGALTLQPQGMILVLSVPVSAFQGVDEDRDQKLSAQELDQHATTIEREIHKNLWIQRGDRRFDIQDLLVTLSTPKDMNEVPATHLTVMGKFSTEEMVDDDHGKFELHLYGANADEQLYSIKVKKSDRVHLFTLDPTHPSAVILGSALQNFLDFFLLGNHHVLSGMDHVLFLLVVLSAGFGIRQIVATLTAFTLGHAATLVLCVYSGWRVSPTIIEPAIALTIIFVAVYDRWGVNYFQCPVWLRPLLVFGCALIHGLALSGELLARGLDSAHRVVTLLGFNLGIETAQLGIALVCYALLRWMQGRVSDQTLGHMRELGSYLALVTACVWFWIRIDFA